ncbi:TetR/AcrR family transcriptional regulator [Pseudonocardia sp. NPDC049154]|uniref:TetR/AcrR family transcriptional regulator n=1 Tax=Pseudonocardia sp. NPDC049154 TaxID=3155501 RepID=UPI0033F5CF23
MPQDAPRRRGRPPNPHRRAEVVHAAARAFHRHGFAGTSMKEVAASLGITASALYRHSAGKMDLLDAALETGLADVEAALGPPETPLAPTLRALARSGLRRADFWTLIRRDVRHLGSERQRVVRLRMREVVDGVGIRLRRERPGLGESELALLTRASLATLSVPSQFGRRGVAGPVECLLADRALAVAMLPIEAAPEPFPLRVATPFDPDASARERLMSCSARLFAHSGFSSVSLAEIGAAAGIAGPGVYRHFAGKTDLLVGVLRRASEWVALDLEAALALDDPLAALHRMVHDHVEIAVRNWELFRVFQIESRELPPADRAWILRSHRTFTDSLVAQLRAARPELDEHAARVAGLAAIAIVNDLAGSPRLRAESSFPPRLAATVLGCLGVPTAGPLNHGAR